MDDEKDLKLRKSACLIQLACLLIMIVIVGYCMTNNIGVYHEPVYHNITEHVMDKKIINYNTLSSSGIEYYVFTDNYKFEMTLTDYNKVKVGDEVITTVSDFGDGTGHFNNNSFRYHSYGG